MVVGLRWGCQSVEGKEVDGPDVGEVKYKY